MDIKTLVLALALGNLSLCVMLFFFEYENEKTASMSTWALAKQCQAAAWLLIYLRGLIPDLLSIPLAYALLFAGVAADAGALWEAAGRSGWRRVLLPLLGLAIAGFLLAYALNIGPGARAALGMLTVCVFLLAGVAALALGWSAASLLRRCLVLTMALLSVAVGARGVLSATVPQGWSWVSSNMIQALGFGALYLMMFTNAFGCLLLRREQLQRALARLELVDALTGVPNQRGFYLALAPWLALARRPGPPTALMILKLDHFRRVNDSYGHPVGDLVLKAMVGACRQQLRDSDLMGRLGGAEFAVQLPRTSLADALMVAERMRAAVAHLPLKTERAVLGLTASVGVTTILAEDSSVSLFRRADAALQSARQGGCNQVAAAPAGALAA